MISFLKKGWVRLILILLSVGLIVGFFLLKGEPSVEYVFEEVKKGNIVQSVSVTGSIKAEPTIDLRFQKNGIVESIFAKEGQRVKSSDVLAVLENKSLSLEVKRNRANINYVTAQYNQLKSGTRDEEIKIAEADVESARASYNSALSEQKNVKSLGESNIELMRIALKQAEDNLEAIKQELETTTILAEKEIAKLELGGDNTQTVALEGAYLKARTVLDSMITNLQDSIFTAEEIVGVRGSGYFLLSQHARDNIERMFYLSAKDSLDKAINAYQNLNLNSSYESVEDVLSLTLVASDKIISLLTQIGIDLQALPYDRDDLKALVLKVTSQNNTLASSILSLRDIQTNILNIKTGTSQDSETLILNYKLQIDSANSRYVSSKNALKKAEFDLEQAIINAENNNKNAESLVDIRLASLHSAETLLNLKKSPVRDVDLAPLSAQIALANIALEMAENEYMDSRLIAPIDGLITFINGKVGENVSFSDPTTKSFLTIQADNLVVEANVPETDITKIKPGNDVEMTIDAFDFTEKFNGKVVYVDTAETIIQGVVYYQIKTVFDLKDDRLKSGMTTNLNITTEQKESVMVIPSKAIKYENNLRYVEVLKNGNSEKVFIEVGLESDQYSEVLSGLNIGDKIITFVK